MHCDEGVHASFKWGLGGKGAFCIMYIFLLVEFWKCCRDERDFLFLFACVCVMVRDVKVKYHFALRRWRSLSDPFYTNLGPKGDDGMGARVSEEENVTSEFQAKLCSSVQILWTPNIYFVLSQDHGRYVMQCYFHKTWNPVGKSNLILCPSNMQGAKEQMLELYFSSVRFP